MMFAAAAELAVRSSILLGCAWLAARLTGAVRGSAALRHAVWMLGFAAIASLPLLAKLLPPLLLPVLPAQPTALATAMPAAGAAMNRAAPVSAGFEWLTLAYVAVLLLLIGRLAIGRILLERLWRKAQPADRYSFEIADIRRLLGIHRRLEVRITSEPVVPMTWGSLRPRILLPRSSLGWNEGKLRSVLLHELAHVSRHDTLATLAAQAVCAFYWANPLVWLAVRQMRLAQEQACDDLVLSNHGSAVCYARDLLDSACPMRPRFARASLAMAGRTDLEKRLRAILGDECRRPLNGWFLATAASVASLSGALAATIVPIPAEAHASPLLAQAPSKQIHRVSRSVAAPTQSLAKVEDQMGRAITRSVRSSMPMHKATLFPAALYVAETSPPVEPMGQYQSETAAYALAVDRYQDDMRTYRRKCDEYQRRVQEYRAKLASLGPSDLPPVAPAAPVRPVAPVQPVIPPTPPTPPST
jgi:beta-lactamase regulating signal transducer with metallopeptidase domain